MSQFLNDAVFWVEVEKITPNPFQPRREFDEVKLRDLSDSIRMYGVLQPLVVTRKEISREDGSFSTEYELVSGERRLRASKIAGLSHVPVLIRGQEQSDREKLEMAIIENLQREDLNVVDRARAFQRLIEEFGFKHAEVGKKLGKSREYVSNSIRILALPQDIIQALSEGKISEGHTRPLLMLSDRPQEQITLFKDIIMRKVTVREAELISRRIATERARKFADPEIDELEERFKTALGTRVRIEKKENGGRISIDFFSTDDLKAILELLNRSKVETRGIVSAADSVTITDLPKTIEVSPTGTLLGETPIDDRSLEEKIDDENSDIYSIKNFTI